MKLTDRFNVQLEIFANSDRRLVSTLAILSLRYHEFGRNVH